MSLARLSVSVIGLAAIVATVIAAATIWLIVTDPVTVADAIAQGEVTPLVEGLARVVVDALWGLLRYL